MLRATPGLRIQYVVDSVTRSIVRNSVSVRFNVAARVFLAWIVSLPCLAMISLWLNPRYTLNYPVEFIYISAPLIVLAIMISLIFSYSIARHPFYWVAAAILASAIPGAALAGGFGVACSFCLSIPAACVFLASLHFWPIRTRQNTGKDQASPLSFGPATDDQGG